MDLLLLRVLGLHRAQDERLEHGVAIACERRQLGVVDCRARRGSGGGERQAVDGFRISVQMW